MANTKISQLTANINPTGNEELVYAYNNTNGKMTVNTMKTFIQPDLSGYQEKLVNQSNIKSINGESLLGSGNIIVSGGGGGVADTGYDCVVDASGNGDYTTITAALADGNRSMLILPGTYNETEGNTVTDTDRLILHGVDRVSTVINVTLSSDGYFIKHAWTQAGNVTDDIRNLTINMTCNKTNSYLIEGYTSDTGKTIDITMDSCTVNVTSGMRAFAYIFYVYPNQVDDANAVLYNNCDINITDGGYYVALYDNLMGQYTNCRFYLKATGSRTAIEVSNLDGCQVRGRATNSGWTYTSLINVVNSDVEIFDNQTLQTGRMYINGAKNSKIELHYGAHPSTDIAGSTVIPDWAAETSYSVGDYVRWGQDLLECIEAHTSQSPAPWMDEEKWSYVSALVLKGHTEGCDISLGSGSTNAFITLYGGTGVYYHSNRFENNLIYGSSRKIFTGGDVIISGNQITTSVLQNRGATSVISGNRICGAVGGCTLYYADNYSLIQNNVLIGQSSAGVISVLGSATSTSTVANNLLVDARDLS